MFYEFLKRYKIRLFFLLTALIFLFVSMMFNVRQELLLRPDAWSRSISIPVSAEHKSVYTRETPNSIVVNTANEHKIDQIVIDKKDFSVTDKQSFDIPINPYYSFWVSDDNQTIYYVADKQLWKMNGDKAEKLGKDIQRIYTGPDTIVAVEGDQMIALDPSTGKQSALLAGKEAENIKSISIDPALSSIMALSNSGGQENTVFYFSKTKTGYHKKVLTYISPPVKEVTDLYFTQMKGKVHVIFSTVMKEGGSRSTSSYYAMFSPEKSEGNLSAKPLEVYDQNGKVFDAIQHVQLNQVGNSLQLFFSADGLLKKSNENINMYSASKEGGKWIAKRISTSYQQATLPLLFNGDEAIWLSFDGKIYHVWGAATKDAIIKQSEKLTQTDWKRALESTMISLSSCMVFFLLSLILFAPAVVMIFISYVFKINNAKWLGYMSIAATLILQFIVMQKILNSHFAYVAPSYLTFPYSHITLPFIIDIISFFAFYMTENKEWGYEGKAFYFVGVNIWFAALVVGSYMI
ncbi:hypothetical protein [Falsibacillus albus]|uniref:Uncharacterized protein n=1 Tax=Falsibacillus albus TaxID=2478915 RepID=A0A3L7K345_9BACI|nr:hypothetical protein [Falsibacillus albus]RLQ96724.1 hypothetical protein D9X91_06370 [Falsibacillus albus]